MRRIGFVCRNFKLKPADLQTMTAKEAVNLIFDVIGRLRKSYELASERHLITMKTTSAGDSKVFAAMNLQFLKLSKFTDDEIKEIVKEHGDLSTIDPNSLADIIDEKRKCKMGLNGNSQKIVRMADLEGYITEGWEYVRDLPDGKAIVRLSK